MAILMIFDGQKNPPAFRTMRYGETTQESEVNIYAVR